MHEFVRRLAWEIGLGYRPSASDDERAQALEAAVTRVGDELAIGGFETRDAHALGRGEQGQLQATVGKFSADRAGETIIVGWGLRMADDGRPPLRRLLIAFELSKYDQTLFAAGVVSMRPHGAADEVSLACGIGVGGTLRIYRAVHEEGRLLSRVMGRCSHQQRMRSESGRARVDELDQLWPEQWAMRPFARSRAALEEELAAARGEPVEALRSLLGVLEEQGASVIPMPAELARPDWTHLWTEQGVQLPQTLWLTLEGGASL